MCSKRHRYSAPPAVRQKTASDAGLIAWIVIGGLVFAIITMATVLGARS